MTENTGNKPFLSIITVTRNNARGVQRSYISMRNQSLQDFEWIVIDGNSSDNTCDFLQKTNATWISEPDRGIYDAMNKGIERINGRYVLFLNAGDLLARNDIIAEIFTAAQNDPDFIYGDAYEMDTYKTARTPTIKHGMFTHHQAMIYKADKITDLRYNLEHEIAADYEFTARFLQQNPNALYIPRAICDFEPGGISQQKASQGRAEQQQIRKDLGLCSQIENGIITAAQACLWSFRENCPSLYWRLKSWRNTARGKLQI
jgi:putative colanic acid biosynthesis glycosyltransferase